MLGPVVIRPDWGSAGSRADASECVCFQTRDHQPASVAALAGGGHHREPHQLRREDARPGQQ